MPAYQDLSLQSPDLARFHRNRLRQRTIEPPGNQNPYQPPRIGQPVTSNVGANPMFRRLAVPGKMAQGALPAPEATAETLATSGSPVRKGVVPIKTKPPWMVGPGAPTGQTNSAVPSGALAPGQAPPNVYVPPAFNRLRDVPGYQLTAGATPINPIRLPVRGQSSVMLPGESERMRVTLPDPNANVQARLAAFDTREAERLRREQAQVDEDASRRGTFSAGGASELFRRNLESSQRERLGVISEAEVEAERQRQSNAREQFVLNADEAARERGFNLDRFTRGRASDAQDFSQDIESFGAGEKQSERLGTNELDRLRARNEAVQRERDFALSERGQDYTQGMGLFEAGEKQAGRLGTNELERFREARNVVQQDRDFAIQQRAQELQAQGQTFDQSIRQATTEQDLREGQQRIQLNELNAQLATDQQTFQQTIEAHRENRATTAQLEDSAIKFFTTQRAAEQQDFENDIKELQVKAALTQAEAAELRDAFRMAMDYRKNEQSVLLEIMKLASADEATRIAGMEALFRTAGSFVEGAMNRYVNMATGQTTAAGANADINSATDAQNRNRIGGIASSVGDILGGLFG